VLLGWGEGVWTVGLSRLFEQQITDAEPSFDGEGLGGMLGRVEGSLGLGLGLVITRGGIEEIDGW
jgi:hypothetical protein